MIIHGNCLDILPTLPAKSVHCVVTSPPYWGLRDYGVPGQIGLEKSPDEYVATMVQVFHEVRRVLRDDGSLWLNLGDSYAANRSYQVPDTKHIDVGNSKGMRAADIGLKPKDLCGIPWRVAFALQADGWYLRSDIIWHKPNPMPESVTDRPTKSHEYLFLLTKSARYFYDAEAVKEPSITGDVRKPYAPGQVDNRGNGHDRNGGIQTDRDGATRNLRSVWTIPPQPSSESHFAMFPEALVVPCIKAGTSEKGVCPDCGAPWERVVDMGFADHTGNTESQYDKGTTANRLAKLRQAAREAGGEYQNQKKTIGWRPTCSCGKDPMQATVLDPFGGMMTVGVVCEKLGRKFIGIDLNPEYAQKGERRKGKATNLFSKVV